jgi:hypothetical protein
MSHFRNATKEQWYQDDYPGADMHLTHGTMVAALHTTEGMGWPSYRGGSIAPNYTGMPPIGFRRGHWRVHFPDEKSSRALENDPGGVETNTMNVVQFELIGTCDPAHEVSWGKLRAGRDYVYWPKANGRQRRWLARILADMHRRHGLNLHPQVEFKAYPLSYGSDNGVRLTFEQWHKFAGVLGHQHVPENVHGDPGNIAIRSILYWARFYVRTHR